MATEMDLVTTDRRSVVGSGMTMKQHTLPMLHPQLCVVVIYQRPSQTKSYAPFFVDISGPNQNHRRNDFHVCRI